MRERYYDEDRYLQEQYGEEDTVYQVEVKQEFRRVIKINASSPEDALRTVRATYLGDKVLLSPEYLSGIDIHLVIEGEK